MLHHITPAHLQRPPVQPDHHGAKSSRHSRAIFWRHQHVSAAEIDLIFQLQVNRHWSERLRQIAVITNNRPHSRSLSGRQRQNIITRTNHSARYTAGKSPEVRIRSNHNLYWESQTLEGLARGHWNRLQVFEQRWPFIPKHPRASLNDVVPLERANWHALYVRNTELLCHLQKIPLHIQKHIFPVIDEVHLVHRRQHIAYSQQRSDERVTPCLRQNSFAGIHKNHRQVRRRRSRGHIARVLLVARSICDDKFPPRGGEVPIGDVDRDTLLSFRAQPIRK